ncbi:basic proline-rich protein-like isoform X2 [Hemicordylus capensis]|uniref:basic proline-rich protein-like isoform X2 n=1 Tax=Hemicordylus capensis TaxID=884348 RepID=UPI0023021D39|nr:basic proline-rich protein-like isoform X2 [Hemicordylus capensis]
MPRKAKEKKGGRPIRPPKRPAAPPPSSSEDEDEEMGVIRALTWRMEALERARNVPSDPGAGPSGGGGIPPPKVPRRTRGAARSQSLSSRLEALEKAGGPAGPDTPSEPSGPSMPSPDLLGQPAPARPPDPVPALPGPVSPQPVAPAEQPLRDPSLPLAPGAGGAAAPVQVLVCGHSLVFWAFRYFCFPCP